MRSFQASLLEAFNRLSSKNPFQQQINQLSATIVTPSPTPHSVVDQTNESDPEHSTSQFSILNPNNSREISKSNFVGPPLSPN